MNEQIPETEQWKLNGDCKKCRRAEYCRKKCTAWKKTSDALTRSLCHSIIDNVMPSSIADQAKKWI